MVTRKDLIIAVLVTFCLTAMIFIAMPISANTYDPLLDANHDGKINLQDLVQFAQSYGTTGDPTISVKLATNFFNSTYSLGPNGDPEAYLNVDVPIEGYRQVSIYIFWQDIFIPPPGVVIPDYGVNCTIDMGQFTQGLSGFALFYDYEVPPIYNSQTYSTIIPVQGQELMFLFHNLNTYNVTSLYLRVYMTA